MLKEDSSVTSLRKCIRSVEYHLCTGIGGEECHLCTGIGGEECHLCTGIGGEECHLCTSIGGEECHLCTSIGGEECHLAKCIRSRVVEGEVPFSSVNGGKEYYLGGLGGGGVRSASYRLSCQMGVKWRG